MAFIQLIEFKTSRVDELRALGEEYEANVGDSTVVRGAICADRDRENWYFNIVEFESYESAMQNSESPATQEMAAKMGKLCDEGPNFYNLDVIQDIGS